MRASRIVRQPFGAAMIHGNTGQVDVLNEVAARILLGLIEGKAEEQIAGRLSEEYEVPRADALADVETFRQELEQSLDSRAHSWDAWEVSGSWDRTSIVQADLELTLACDQRCTYCFVGAGRAAPDEICPADWERVVDWLLAQGLRQATVTGGDPLISDAFWPVVERLSVSGVHVQVFTNGARVSSDVASRLSALPINFVQVSLDGTTPRIHDRYRGESFEHAVRAIRLLRDHGIPVVIGASVFPDTVQEITHLAEFASSVGARLRCSGIDARGRAWSLDPSTTRTLDLQEAITGAMEAVSDQRRVFLDDVSDEVELDGELHCKFYHGMVAVGSNGTVRPCLEGTGFFRKVAPWALDCRKAWEFDSIEAHAAFETVGTINETHKPNIGACGSCQFLRYCEGCLLAGFTCHERR